MHYGRFLKANTGFSTNVSNTLPSAHKYEHSLSTRTEYFGLVFGTRPVQISA